ncbi:MAG: restriction endonuclease subunit S, partial [Desulfobacterales bacterium]|nr:restriction endonuclease subunit S [Desulfobacterales bacterium]
YFVLILQTQRARGQIEVGANGASPSMKNIGQSVIKNLKAGVPPLDEQNKILNFITNFEGQLSKVKNAITKELKSLFEFKSSLISEAVTGKIKI